MLSNSNNIFGAIHSFSPVFFFKENYAKFLITDETVGSPASFRDENLFVSVAKTCSFRRTVRWIFLQIVFRPVFSSPESNQMETKSRRGKKTRTKNHSKNFEIAS